MENDKNSCDITNKNNCCSTSLQETSSSKKHWNNIYSKGTTKKLGWYETDLSPTLDLLAKTGLKKSARILNVGAGTTTLIDKLLADGFSNVLATDISQVSLTNLKTRLGTKSGEIVYITDDLTNPNELLKIDPVDLWIDRAVLHFFNKPEEQDVYFDLLNKLVNPGGYVILAEYNLSGALKCAGLPVHRFSKEMLQEKMGKNFILIDSFEYIYTMPHGDLRPYIYTLFQKF